MEPERGTRELGRERERGGALRAPWGHFVVRCVTLLSSGGGWHEEHLHSSFFLHRSIEESRARLLHVCLLPSDTCTHLSLAD